MDRDSDIHGQEQDVSALKIPEDWYRAMIQTANEGIWLIDANAHTLYVNDRMATMLGASPAAMIGHTVSEYTFPEDRGGHVERIHHNITGVSEHFEARFRRKDGSELVVLGSSGPLRGEQGAIVGALGMFTDVTERKRMETELRSSELRFRRLVESNIVGIVIADLFGAIYEANDVFLEMVGYTREELLAGKIRWDTLTPPEYAETITQSTQLLRETGIAGPAEKAYIRKDGRQVPVLVGLVLFDEERSLALGIILDISERKELEQRKDEFISLASHELRTPLTSIRGNLQLAMQRLLRLQQAPALLEEAVDKINNITALLHRVMRQVDVEHRLISDMLDVSRMQASKLELAPARFDLAALTREAVENQRLATPTRVIHLDLPAEPVPVIVDHDRIEQVISNYLTNALKYSLEDQEVKVGLRLKGQQAHVWVQDRGPGLSPEAQKHLWERFYRAPGVKVLSGSAGGLGLGLYICRTIIMLHNGQVGLQSALGQGSTFWFALPLAPESPTPPG